MVIPLVNMTGGNTLGTSVGGGSIEEGLGSILGDSVASETDGIVGSVTGIAYEGTTVGDSVEIGSIDALKGTIEGGAVVSFAGNDEGSTAGDLLGITVGRTRGNLTGITEGSTVGALKSTELGLTVGLTGALEGDAFEGAFEITFDGDTLTLVPGCRVRDDGASVGGSDFRTEGLIETVGILLMNGADVLTME